MNILAIPSSYGLSKPISGGQNRFLNLAMGLKKGGNNIVVLESQNVIHPNDNTVAKMYYYRDYKFKNVILGLFRDMNISFILNLFRILKDEDIDLIQISTPFGILSAKLMIELTRKKIPIVYDAHDVQAIHAIDLYAKNPNYSNIIKVIMPKYVLFFETIVCRYASDHIISVSNEERVIFIKKYKLKTEKVDVIPSGCHISPISNRTAYHMSREKFGINPDKIIVLFHGSFFHPPNKDAFERIDKYIAPTFENVNEDVLFVIVGTDVPKFERSNIISLGFVEDLYTVLSMADIAIAPLTMGGGTKLKILDYMSAGLPTVTTKKGINVIDAKNGEHALIVEDVDEKFIGAIEYLINNVDERKKIGSIARNKAYEQYNWDKIGAKLIKLYWELLEEKRNTKRADFKNR